MKIQLRDVAILGFGFILGTIFTATLSLPTESSRLTSHKEATIANSYAPSIIVSTTNLQWNPPFPSRWEPSFRYAEDPHAPPLHRDVDLIDTRYKPTFD